MDNEDVHDRNVGISRRALLRRGAVVGGSLVWAAPAVQSFARPALAQEASPVAGEACTIRVVGEFEEGGVVCDLLEIQVSGADCCDCLQTATGLDLLACFDDLFAEAGDCQIVDFQFIGCD